MERKINCSLSGIDSQLPDRAVLPVVTVVSSRFVCQSLWALGYIERACCHCDALVREVSVLPGGTDVPSSKVGLAFCVFDLVVNGSDVTRSTPARVCVCVCVCVAAVSYCTGYIRSLLCHKKALSTLSLWHWAYHMLVGILAGLQLSDLKNPKDTVAV